MSRDLLRERARAAIREQVASGRLKPGAQIVEATLATEIGVSRSPVREALRELEREGVVVSHPNRGCFVVELGPEDAEEIVILRAGLEGLAARLAVEHMSRHDLRALGAIVQRMERTATDSPVDRARFLEADHEFHSEVVRFSGHGRLVRQWKSLDPLVWLLNIRSQWGEEERDPKHFEKVSREHWELVDALSAGDPEAAQRAVWEHIVRRAPVDPYRHLGGLPAAIHAHPRLASAASARQREGGR